VIGKVQARCHLSGIPYIELRFNPFVENVLPQAPLAEPAIQHSLPTSSHSSESESYDSDSTPAEEIEEGVRLDDITFHACVDVESFMSNHLVCFVPPGNESFDLMRY